MTKEQKQNILKEELKRVNSHLPANVYIPFVNSKLPSFKYFSRFH